MIFVFSPPFGMIIFGLDVLEKENYFCWGHITEKFCEVFPIIWSLIKKLHYQTKYKFYEFTMIFLAVYFVKGQRAKGNVNFLDEAIYKTLIYNFYDTFCFLCKIKKKKIPSFIKW